jgi:hypothetical protein
VVGIDESKDGCLFDFGDNSACDWCKNKFMSTKIESDEIAS